MANALVEEPGRWRQLRDLAWLLGQCLRVAPGPCAVWIALSAARGFLVPAQLWLTKWLVDALVAQTGQSGAAGSAPVAPAPGGIGLPLAPLALLALALIAGRAMNDFALLAQAPVRYRVAAWLQTRIMRQAAGLDLVLVEDRRYFDRLSQAITDPEGRSMQVLSEAMQVLRATPAMLGYAFGLAALTPLLPVLILAACLPTVWLYVSSGQMHSELLRQQTPEHRLGAYYAGILTGREFAKEVRLYGLAGYLVDRWGTLFWQTHDAQRRLAFRLGLKQRLAVVGSVVLSMLALLWVVGAGLSQGTPGEFALLFQSYHGIIQELFTLGFSLRTLGERSGYAAEVRAFLSLPAAPIDPPTGAAQGRPFPRPLREGVRFEDVWFTYPGASEPALAGVSFSIRAGETVAIVGENGAGKTTLVKLLLGLYRPDRGRITVDGVDLQEIDSHHLRRAASAVFQQFLRYQLTLRENVALSGGQPSAPGGSAPDDGAVLAALEKAGAERIVQAHAEGLETLLGPDVGGVDLSGGQWQRVALARAFYRDAELLVLDEPTAALDPLAELSVFERFTELGQGKTAVLISHRLGMARLADRVLVMAHARLVEDGVHQALVERQGEYASLFGAQARWYA